jgi:DNA repair protein RadD
MTDQPAPALRPYQEKGVAEIRQAFAGGARRVLYVAPTGSGKTVLFAYVVAGAVARGNSVVIVGHRQEIVDQIDGALDVLGVAHCIIAAGHPETPGPVQVASAATLVRRLGNHAAPDLLVLDEAHHAVAGTWEKIIAAAPEARILGCSATPERFDGKGLSDVFETMVLGPSTAELIGQGFLSRFTAFAPDRSPDLAGVRSRAGDYAIEQLSQAMSRRIVIGAAVDEYARRCAGAPAIVFAVDIAHSQLVAERFAERGYRAAHVDGDTPADERRSMIAALGSGELQRPGL